MSLIGKVPGKSPLSKNDIKRKYILVKLTFKCPFYNTILASPFDNNVQSAALIPIKVTFGNFYENAENNKILTQE